MEDLNYQTFLKIMPWEAFFEHCCHRVAFEGHKFCAQMHEDAADKTCEEADKETMVSCPVWKTLRNFYSGKAWQSIKEKEDRNGRHNEKERQAIAQECSRNQRKQGQAHGRFRTESL